MQSVSLEALPVQGVGVGGQMIPVQMAGGPHFAGNTNSNLFPENAGLECRKSALWRPVKYKI